MLYDDKDDRMQYDPVVRKAHIDSRQFYMRALAMNEALRNVPLSKGAGLIRFQEQPEFLQYYKDCQDELERMKKHYFGEDTKVTYFHFIKTHLDKLTGYARNEDVVGGFKTNAYKTDYPIYASRLEQMYNIAAARNDTIEEVTALLSETLKFADSQPEVYGIIFKHLKPDTVEAITSRSEPAEEQD